MTLEHVLSIFLQNPFLKIRLFFSVKVQKILFRVGAGQWRDEKTKRLPSKTPEVTETFPRFIKQTESKAK